MLGKLFSSSLVAAKNTKRAPKVFVGASGGVDSSVTLALLQKQGYDVVGVFIRTWQPDFIECTWRDERRDAMRVCAHLRVPFVELDLEQEYKQGVADYMIREYAAGRTPNPDVMCNKEVKFGGFLKWARKNGADYIATGHYARVENNVLMRGVDNAKDQSYFLWSLTKAQLKQVLFPVGHLPKAEVRVLAKQFKIPVATKKDSQGICFIGEIDMKEFLAHYLPSREGHVVNTEGEVIGTHPGALYFTLGERHGFTISEKTPDDEPYYVIGKDIVANTLTVTNDVHEAPVRYEVSLVDTIWRVPVSQLKKKKTLTAQIRYHGKHMPMRMLNESTIRFADPDFSLSPGQSVVVYDDMVCVGGGIVA